MTDRLSVMARIDKVLHEPVSAMRRAETCAMVIFGAGGDLTKRKLMPALYHLRKQGLVPDDFTVVGVAREPYDDDSYRDMMQKAIKENAGQGFDQKIWDQFSRRINYLCGDFGNPSTYRALQKKLETASKSMTPECGRLFYLAIPPSV